MAVSLEEKAVKGFVWNGIEAFAGRGLGFFISIILARIIDPSDFGLLGISNIIISLSQIFVVGGFATALIQASNLTILDKSTAFLFNISVSIIIYIIIFLIAPHLSTYFEEEKLTRVIRIIGISIIINGMVVVPTAILSRELCFKKLSMINISSTIITGCVCIFAAYNGAGVYALVLQILMTALIRSLLLWIHCGWIPNIIFSVRSFNKIFQFGYKVFLMSLLKAVSDNILSILIGRYYSTTQLGYFTKSRQIQRFPSDIMTNILNKTTFPYFSKIQSDSMKLASTFVSILNISAILITPVLLFLNLHADILFEVVLTEKWLPAVPYFRILCLIGIFIPINAIFLNSINSKGLPGIALLLDVAEKIILLTLLIVFCRYSIKAMLWSYLFSVVVGFCIKLIVISKVLELERKMLLIGIFEILGINFGLFYIFKYFNNIILSSTILGLVLFMIIHVSLYLFLVNRFQLIDIVALKKYYMVTSRKLG